MFWERFVQLCAERNTKPNPVAKELGISSGAVTNWKNGAVPQSATLKRIADYFGVSTSYLLGIVDDPDPIALIDPSKKAPPLIEKIDEAMLDMSEEELEDLNKYIDFLRSKRRGGKS